jgi:hypothetical protein
VKPFSLVDIRVMWGGDEGGQLTNLIGGHQQPFMHHSVETVMISRQVWVLLPISAWVVSIAVLPTYMKLDLGSDKNDEIASPQMGCYMWGAGSW